MHKHGACSKLASLTVAPELAMEPGWELDLQLAT